MSELTFASLGFKYTLDFSITITIILLTESMKLQLQLLLSTGVARNFD